MGRLTTSWIPATNISAPLKNNAAAITGRGILTITLANFGKHESATSQPAMGHARIRLVTPVIFSMPTRLGLALIPGAANTPPTAQPIPSAITPPEMLSMLGRRHAASFICWHVVNTPTTRRPDARPAMAKGNIKDGSKL